MKRADLKGNSGVRILGVQEIDIVSMVKSITKYAITIIDPLTIRYHLEKACCLARSGRRGPVWLDIPLDVQAASIEPDRLKGFDPAELEVPGKGADVSAEVRQVLQMLATAERPVLLIGNGVRLAGAAAEVVQLVERLNVPVLTTWLGLDLLADDHPLNFGRPGSIAPRGANFTLQNSDFLLCIGTRLDMALTAYAHEKFARARKVMVDIDEAEIRKMKTPIHLPIIADAGVFIRNSSPSAAATPCRPPNWLSRCRSGNRAIPSCCPSTGNARTAEHVSLRRVLSRRWPRARCRVGQQWLRGRDLLARVPRESGPASSTIEAQEPWASACQPPSALHRGRATPHGLRRWRWRLSDEHSGTADRRPPGAADQVFVVNNGGYASIRVSARITSAGWSRRMQTSGLTMPDLGKLPPRTA